MRYDIVVCDSDSPTYEVSGNYTYYVIEGENYVKKEGTEISVPMYEFTLDNAYNMLHKVKMNFHIIEKVRLFVYSEETEAGLISKCGLLFWVNENV